MNTNQNSAAITLVDQVHAICDLCEIKKEIPTTKGPTLTMTPHSRLLILAQKAGFNLTPAQINTAITAHQAYQEERDEEQRKAQQARAAVA